MKYLHYLLLTAFLLTGCTVPQKTEMGANSNRDEGFSGYGVNQARQLEGPLSDLMVPDQSPKGLVDPAPHLVREGAYITGKRDLSMHVDRSINGQRILNNRPGVVRDKYAHSNNPNVKRKTTVQQRKHYQATSEVTLKIEQRVERLENVRDAHVITDGERFVVGLESSEQDRPKLIRTVKEEISGIADLNKVYITTDRIIINRMNALEHHVNLPRPFESIGGAIGDIADLIDDAAHGRR
jgi:hypothetical protein